MNKPITKNKGLTILEILIYMAILLLVVFAIFKSVSSTFTSHRAIKLSQTLEASGAVSMERILREIRNATSVDVSGSTLNSSPGVLKLTGTDENGVSYTTTFSVIGGVLNISKDGGPQNALTASNISLSSLIFRHVVNSNTEAVKVEASFLGGTGSSTKDLDLFGFAVLRGSY